METEKNTQQQVTKAFYNCFANASFHRLHQFITTIRECRASAFLLDTKKHKKKGFLQPSIFPIKCVISDTKIYDDTLYFRQLS